MLKWFVCTWISTLAAARTARRKHPAHKVKQKENWKWEGKDSKMELTWFHAKFHEEPTQKQLQSVLNEDFRCFWAEGIITWCWLKACQAKKLLTHKGNPYHKQRTVQQKEDRSSKCHHPQIVFWVSWWDRHLDKIKENSSHLFNFGFIDQYPPFHRSCRC